MKKCFFIIVLNLLLYAMGSAQCDNFGYYITEIISPANEVYFSSLELNTSLSRSTDSEELVEIQVEIKKSYSLIKDVRNSLGFVEVAIENAEANAQNCYCINGQKVAAKLEEQYDELSFYSEEIYKLLKSAEKCKNVEQIRQLTDLCFRYLPKLQELSDSIAIYAGENIHACN